VTVRPVYVGFAPLASCHWQSLANLLESHGFADAKRRICLSWGFSWNGEDGVLGNSGRWLRSFNEVFDAELLREEFESWAQANRRERVLLATGKPFVAEIDSYEVPSEYRDSEHVPHTVLVLQRDARRAVLLDTMNMPELREYPTVHYRRMRTHTCVDRLHLYSLVCAPRRDLVAEDLLGEVYRLFEESWACDVDALEAYLDWVAPERAGEIDVCRVGAERLFLASTFALLAEVRPALSAVSHGLASLSKRWYLLHTLAGPGMVMSSNKRDRIRRLLADLHERELRLAETFRRESENPSDRPQTLSFALDSMETNR
jgi:hypothetical protein